MTNDKIPDYCIELYKQIAEIRAFRLSGYSQDHIPVIPTTQQVLDAMKAIEGDNFPNWVKEAQPKVIEETINLLISIPR